MKGITMTKGICSSCLKYMEVNHKTGRCALCSAPRQAEASTQEVEVEEETGDLDFEE